MFRLQTFKIPPGALLITCFLHCCESPSVILGLSLHCDCSLLQVTPLCGLPVSFQSYRFLSFLIGGLPFHMSPAFIFFHSSSAEGIKLNVFKARKLEYLSLKNSAHSNMHVWGHYTVLRTGRRFGTSVGNEQEHFHPHEWESHTNMNIADAMINLCYIYYFCLELMESLLFINYRYSRQTLKLMPPNEYIIPKVRIFSEFNEAQSSQRKT